MDPIETYCNLDLNGLRSKLMDGVDREAGLLEITLSGNDDAVPGLTQHANAWLGANIQVPRKNALSAVETLARQIQLPGNKPGFCPPLELDREIRGNANRLRELTDAFHAKHRSTLEDLKKANDACQDKYNQLDRNAKVHPRWQEMLPMALVAIPEMVFNYDAFRKLLAHYAIDSGLAASGIVVVIAATMAFAGHHVGLFLRHYNYSFRGGDIARKGDAIRPLGLGLFLLLLSLGSVGVARYFSVLPEIERAILIGEQPPNPVVLVAALLIGNLVVFGLNVAIAFAMHDKDPDYENHARKKLELEKRADKLRQKHLDPQVQDIARKQDSDRRDIEPKKRTMLAQEEYTTISHAFERIQAKDREVEGMLSEYAGQLGSALQANKPKFRFARKNYSGGTLTTVQMSIGDYMNQTMQLLRN